MFATLMTVRGFVDALTDGASALYNAYYALLSAKSPIVEKVADFSGVDSSVVSQYFAAVKAWIVERFGESGLYAAYIATAAIVIFVLSKLFKISFSILKLVVVPSVALAFAATFFLPYNFFYFLPVTVSLFSVLLLFRG